MIDTWGFVVIFFLFSFTLGVLSGVGLVQGYYCDEKKKPWVPFWLWKLFATPICIVDDF